MSKKITLTAHEMTPKLAEYVEIFGHRPSPEAFKFRTPAEIEEMAEVALMRKKPVKDWVTRPNRKTGTILDDLYKQDTDIQDPSLPRAEPKVSEKISKKERRKAAIEEHDESQKSKKKLKKNGAKSNEAQEHSVENESLDLSPKRFYSTPNQDYSITNSQASNLRWKRSSSKKEFDINNQASPKTGHIPIKSKPDVEVPPQPVGVQLEPLGSDRKISEKSPMQLPDFVTVFMFGLWSFWFYDWYKEGGWPLVVTACLYFVGFAFGRVSENAGYVFLWAYVAPLPLLFAVIELLDWFGVR